MDESTREEIRRITNESGCGTCGLPNSDDVHREGGHNFDWVRKEIKALVARGNITVEENESIRCNSYEREAMVPALTDEAFCKQMQYCLDNSYNGNRRPAATYNEAVIGLYAPELLKRFLGSLNALRFANHTYLQILDIFRVLLPMLPDSARPIVADLLKESECELAHGEHVFGGPKSNEDRCSACGSYSTPFDGCRGTGNPCTVRRPIP